MPGHTKCCTCHANHLSKPEDLMLQDATPLRKWAPWPPNICDEHVFCTAPATRHASFQILFKFPTPAIVFWKYYQTLTSCSLLERCRIPCTCHAKTNLNLQKWSEHVVFLTYLSAPNLLCFVHFDFQMRFAPQGRALFRHPNFQKWSGNGLFFVYFDFQMCFAPQRCAIFHLARWLRTRRFSEPTFRPSAATNHWKNIVIRDFFTFSRTCIFFLLTLSLHWSSLLFSSLFGLFPPLHIVGSLTSKFPSITQMVDN